MLDPRDLYARIFEIQRPWRVESVDLQSEAGELQVLVVADKSALECPSCGKACRGYDSRRRRWRHLDTCQYRTILVADVPRVQCAEHGVVQVAIPWAGPGSHFTALFERVVIDWISETSLAAVARQLYLSWDEVDGVMDRAVTRGLARREFTPPKRIGVDETSFQKRHEYVTTVCDLDREVILYVSDNHTEESLSSFYKGLDSKALSGIEIVCMDMWRPYIKSTRRHVPDAEKKIAFDKFHVDRQIAVAVNRVRSKENRDLRARGDDILTGTKYLWLSNPENIDRRRFAEFESLRRMALKTARAWAIKEFAKSLWHYKHRGWAERAWRKWLSWALRCRLTPMRTAAKTIRKYLPGILNAIIHRVTNALTEGMNSRIQALKRLACGYRNRERFRRAIYFHLGGLDLYPDKIGATHTKA